MMKNICVNCPKCRSNNLYLIEVWKDHTIQFDSISGQFDETDGVLEPGNPYKVEAKCKACNHQWTIRKSVQISDLFI